MALLRLVFGQVAALVGLTRWAELVLWLLIRRDKQEMRALKPNA